MYILESLILLHHSSLARLLPLLHNAELALLRLETKLGEAVLLLGLHRLRLGDNATPLVHLQILPR